MNFEHVDLNNNKKLTPKHAHYKVDKNTIDSIKIIFSNKVMPKC